MSNHQTAFQQQPTFQQQPVAQQQPLFQQQSLFQQQPVSQQLVRSTTDRRIAGVASGIGYYFGVDPILVRLAFVGLVFAWGIGLLLYPVMWFVMPRERTVGPQPSSNGFPGQQQVQQVSQQTNGGVAPGPGARFDPMTGRPINTEQPRFDPYTGQPLPADETAVAITNATVSPAVTAVSTQRRKRVLAVALLGLSVLAFSNMFWFVAALFVPLALVAGGVMLLRSS